MKKLQKWKVRDNKKEKQVLDFFKRRLTLKQCLAKKMTLADCVAYYFPEKTKEECYAILSLQSQNFNLKKHRIFLRQLYNYYLKEYDDNLKAKRIPTSVGSQEPAGEQSSDGAQEVYS